MTAGVSEPSKRDVARFIAVRMREIYRPSSGKKKAPGEMTLEQIAADLEISKPEVAYAIEGEGDVKPKFERQFAVRHYGSRGKLEEAVAAWVTENPEVGQAPQPTVMSISRDPFIDEVGRKHRIDQRDIDSVQVQRGLLGKHTQTVDGLLREFERQRRAREDRERDDELQALREAAGVKTTSKTVDETIVADTGGDDPLGDLGGAGDIPKLPSRGGRRR